MLRNIFCLLFHYKHIRLDGYFFDFIANEYWEYHECAKCGNQWIKKL